MADHGHRRAPQIGFVLPWIGLLIVVSTTTYGLDLFATALAPVPSGRSMTQTTAGHVLDDAALLDDRVLEGGGAPADATAVSRLTVVTIVGRDPMTGQRQQIQCTVAADRVASDTFVVDYKDFSEFVRGLCGAALAS